MNTCKTCKHWNKFSEQDRKPEFGECLCPSMNGDDSSFFGVYQDSLPLSVSEHFGCIAHERVQSDGSEIPSNIVLAIESDPVKMFDFTVRAINQLLEKERVGFRLSVYVQREPIAVDTLVSIICQQIEHASEPK